MENVFFLRVEIIIFITSLIYIVYYLGDYIKLALTKTGRVVKNKNPQAVERGDSASSDSLTQDEFDEKEHNKISVNSEAKIKITEILRKEALIYERGDYEKAKSLIIEGLTLNKHHKQLNLELANIYNKQGEYKKSEYIYRELIENQKDDFELLKKLGFVLALQKKYKDSIRVYKEAYEKRKTDPGVIDILSDLTFEVEDYKGSIKYATKILKEKPRDIEKLQLLAFSYDTLGEKEKAYDNYQKILEMQPYNEDILAKVEALNKKDSEKAQLSEEKINK